MDLKSKKSLHEEEVAHIFSFLDTKSKLIASSVCKPWMEIFNKYPRLLDDVCITLEFLRYDFLKTFSKMMRRFNFFHFKHVEIGDKFLSFLKKFETQFRRLIFHCCKLLVDTDEPDCKVQNCNSLLELKVSYCFPGDFIGIFSLLPELQSLHLKIGRISPRRILSELPKMIPLCLTRFQIDNFYFKDLLRNTTCYAEFENFIYQRRSSLQSLGFKVLHLAIINMERLSKMEGLRLNRFKLCANYVFEGTLEAFFEHQRGVVSLHLIQMKTDMPIKPYYQYVKDSTVAALSKLLPRLKELSLRRCEGFDESVVAIFKLKFLKKLDLSGCSEISERSFRNAVNEMACTDLRTLNLCHTFIERSTLSQLVTLAPNLQEITLSHSHYLDSRWEERLPRRSGMRFVRQPEQ